jgi:hypothetical protein
MEMPIREIAKEDFVENKIGRVLDAEQARQNADGEQENDRDRIDTIERERRVMSVREKREVASANCGIARL